MSVSDTGNLKKKKKPFPVSLSVYIDMCQKEACLDTIMQLAEKLS